MTKAVLEAEGEGAAAQAVSMVPSPALAVPASLHASLMARLDRLGPAKEVAQIGAAIGREFSHALLAAVVRKPEAELEFGARPSHRSRFAVPGRACHRTQPIYSSMLWCRTRPMARCCANRDARFTPVSPKLSKASSQKSPRAEPELLARHCTEAGLIEKAAALWGKAGQRSLARSALDRGRSGTTGALDQIATLLATPALRREADQATDRAHKRTYAMYKDKRAAETKAAVERARLLIERAEALGEPPEDPLLLYSVLYGFLIREIYSLQRRCGTQRLRRSSMHSQRSKWRQPRS